METLSSAAVFDLEYFFELSPDLLCVTGYDGYFKKINPAVSKILGYTNEELFASPINSFVHPDDREITAEKRKKTVEGQPLLNFENRYLSKSGVIVWLSWTAMLIKRDQLIFAIGKNVTFQKQIEEYDRVSAILEMINDEHQKRFKKDLKSASPQPLPSAPLDNVEVKRDQPSQADQLWLTNFEKIVLKNVGQGGLTLNLIGDELAVSERQLYRRVKQILGITPNKLVRIIRLRLAWEAIASGKYRTISEISIIAGYHSTAHFSRIFREVYGIDVAELL